MSKLFEKTAIKGLTIPNRFVRSATWEGMANDDGSCTQRLIDLMVQLVHGGVGLIITGHTYVSPEGQARMGQMGIYHDDLIAGLTDMTGAVHKAGGSIILQLAHAGCHADAERTGQKAWGASVMIDENGPLNNREMTPEDIRKVVEAFGKGAARAERAGFDGVQIHAAHGYLLSQFLSPFYNKRKDKYGGSLENRARIVLEVLQSVKGHVRADYPVMIKINAQDFVEGGLSADEAVKLAAMLKASGIDAIELSGGVIYSGKLTAVRKGKLDSPSEEVYYRNEAGKLKETVDVPLMLVGGIRSFEVAERLVDDGTTDYISLCRPLIREPDLVNRWKSGDTRKATCESDNLCFKPTLSGEGIYCVVERKLRGKVES